MPLLVNELEFSTLRETQETTADSLETRSCRTGRLVGGGGRGISREGPLERRWEVEKRERENKVKSLLLHSINLDIDPNSKESALSHGSMNF